VGLLRRIFGDSSGAQDPKSQTPRQRREEDRDARQAAALDRTNSTQLRNVLRETLIEARKSTPPPLRDEAPGWFKAPMEPRGIIRYWDGSQWGEPHLSPEYQMRFGDIA
jgi:hypothetical protein